MVPEIWSETDRTFSPEDIIILQICTINDSHMMYGSLDMEVQWTEFFVIMDHFFPFYPLTRHKI